MTLARETPRMEETGPTVDGEVCGTLVGQQERGFYLGVPVPAPGEPTRPQGLVFVPAGRVGQATTHKQRVRVTKSHAEARRKRLLSRLGNVRVR